MQIQTSDPALYDAALLMGQLGGASPSMAVVLKANYDLVSDGPGPRRMQPRGGAKLLLEDEGQMLFSAPLRQPPILNRPIAPSDLGLDPGPPERQILRLGSEDIPLSEISADDDDGDALQLDFDLRREADTALAKSMADIVVRGFVSPVGRLRVNGQTWLTRDSALPGPSDRDEVRNLFGYQPRAAAPRKSAATDLPRFAAFHRRGGKFNDQGTGAALPSGGVVELFRFLLEGAQPDYALRLPDLTRVLRLRVYCGHGPDRPPHWRKHLLGPMHPDTLILDPGAHRAEILWRLHWPADTQPMDRYRSLQIAEGGF